MRNYLQHLLSSFEAISQERWETYRRGAMSADVEVHASAEAAFATLVAWHGRILYRHIWGFVRSSDADDVFQDVLGKLHKHRDDPRLVSFTENVIPWLRQVAIRQCLDQYRATKRRRRREATAGRPEVNTERNVANQLNQSLATALTSLPKNLQQVIALHYFEGMTQQETAEVLGIHRDTVADRLKDALERLRNRMTIPAVAVGTATVSNVLVATPPVLSPSTIEAMVHQTLIMLPAGWSAKHLVLITFTLLATAGGVSAVGWSLHRSRDEANTLLNPVSPEPRPITESGLAGRISPSSIAESRATD